MVTHKEADRKQEEIEMGITHHNDPFPDSNQGCHRFVAHTVTTQLLGLSQFNGFKITMKVEFTVILSKTVLRLIRNEFPDFFFSKKLLQKIKYKDKVLH